MLCEKDGVWQRWYVCTYARTYVYIYFFFYVCKYVCSQNRHANTMNIRWSTEPGQLLLPLVMVRPLDEAASAALLSVAWLQEIGARVLGSRESMQYDSAYCARSSQAAMCFRISSPPQSYADCMCPWIWNYNQTRDPSGKNAAPPKPARSFDAIIRSRLEWNVVRWQHGQWEWCWNQQLSPAVERIRSITIKFAAWHSRICDTHQNVVRLDAQDITSSRVVTLVFAILTNVMPGNALCWWESLGSAAVES